MGYYVTNSLVRRPTAQLRRDDTMAPRADNPTQALRTHRRLLGQSDVLLLASAAPRPLSTMSMSAQKTALPGGASTQRPPNQYRGSSPLGAAAAECVRPPSMRPSAHLCSWPYARGACRASPRRRGGGAAAAGVPSQWSSCEPRAPPRRAAAASFPAGERPVWLLFGRFGASSSSRGGLQLLHNGAALLAAFGRSSTCRRLELSRAFSSWSSRRRPCAPPRPSCP